MGRIVLAVILTLVIIYAVPFVVYSILAVATGLEPPDEGSPALFLTSVLVIKVGTAIGFVLIFHAARGVFRGRWLLYATLWWLMSVIGEAGEAIGPGYSWMEALGGVISETIYWPLAAWATQRLLHPRPQPAPAAPQ